MTLFLLLNPLLEDSVLNLSFFLSYEQIEPPLVPTHNVPERSSCNETTSLVGKLLLSPAMCLYTVKLVPSYLFNPSSVANHMMPKRSFKIAVTTLEDRPSLDVRDVKFILF